MTRRFHPVVVLFLSLALPFSIGACGGGGSAGPGTDPYLESIPYTGVTTQAAIGDNNAVSLAAAAYAGKSAGAAVAGVQSADSAPGSPASAARPIYPTIVSSMANAARRFIGSVTAASGARPLGRTAPIYDNTAGAYSGYVVFSGTADIDTGDYWGTATFVDYSDDGITWLNGVENFSGRINLFTFLMEHFELTFSLFSFRSADGESTISGRVTIREDPTTMTVTMSVRERDEGTGRVFWIDKYSYTATRGPGYVEVDLSGRFYDPVEGWVSLSTGTPIRTFTADTWPSQGILLIEGRGGSRARLVFLSPATFRVVADPDGDDIFEFDSGIRHWPGANRPPTANAGPDIQAGIGSPVSLNGSGSADADGDALTFLWSFSSVPAGSAATLSNVTAPNPTFRPDVPGTYVLQLVVNDGFANSAPDTVIVAALTGGGLFHPAIAIPTGSWPEAVAIGDLNGDGRNDVALVTDFYNAPSNDYKLFVFIQDAGGALLPPVVYGTHGAPGARPESVAIGDLNGDGRNDVAVGLWASGIDVFLQDSAGALGAPVLYATADSNKVRVGDVNDDGRMDIVGIGWGTNTAQVFYQTASGGLSAPVTLNVTHGGYDDLDLGDVNGDGLTDIVVMSGQSLLPNVGILLQRPAGGFEPAAYYTVASGTLTGGVAVGDVTGDGRNDVVLGATYPYGLAVFAQTDTGTLQGPISYPIWSYPEPVEVADVSGDGLKDVVVFDGGRIGVYLQGPGGVLWPEYQYSFPYATHLNPHGLAVGDVNGDGLNDVVAANYNYGVVILYHR